MKPGAWIAGKYRLLRPLGKGSMGEVWAARHAEMDRDVALKLIYGNTPDSADLAARLKREALACGRLQHPNIVRVYDIGETEAGDPFLVMEVLEGETLKARLAARRRLPPPEALEIALEIARALRAAHGAGVVHRDLKPENVYLHKGPDSDAEEVKVLDFGVSKILSVGNLAFTVTGALVGSPAYMSPEQARALKDVDGRADLWSLGVVLFEMIAGRRPFDAQSTMGVITDILSAPIPRLASLVQGVDPRVDELVNRCMQRDIEQRMPSAAAMIGALRPLLMLAPTESDRRPAPSLGESADHLPRVVHVPPPSSGRPRQEVSVEAPTVIHRGAAVQMPARDDDDEKATTKIGGEQAELYRLAAARALEEAGAAAPLVAPPTAQETTRIPEHQAELYRLAAMRATQNNPVISYSGELAPAPRSPGLMTAAMPEQLPPSPSWHQTSAGTHKMPTPSERWPGLGQQEEAEQPTKLMAWKTGVGPARGSRSFAVAITAGLALALVVVAAIVVARCAPDDEAPGAQPGASAAPTGTHR
jgi:eukaryotic-like serine/threonine-protein kinase